MEEVWKPAKYIDKYGNVTDFTGIYEVSNYGRIKSLGRYRIKNGFKHYYKETIKDFSKRTGRYIDLYLIKDRNKYKCLVHRIVLSSFCPESNTYECINHKDYNKHNNFVWVNEDGTIDFEKSNLEWCTSEYNNNYGDRNEKLSKKLTGKVNVTGGCKIVLKLDMNNNFIEEFPSANEVERKYGYCAVNIRRCCYKEGRTAYGFKWRYK